MTAYSAEMLSIIKPRHYTQRNLPIHIEKVGMPIVRCTAIQTCWYIQREFSSLLQPSQYTLGEVVGIHTCLRRFSFLHGALGPRSLALLAALI